MDIYINMYKENLLKKLFEKKKSQWIGYLFLLFLVFSTE